MQHGFYITKCIKLMGYRVVQQLLAVTTHTISQQRSRNHRGNRVCVPKLPLVGDGDDHRALDREHLVELAATPAADADGRHPHDIVLLVGDVHHGLTRTRRHAVNVGLPRPSRR